jgi:hypothetical protein
MALSRLFDEKLEMECRTFGNRKSEEASRNGMPTNNSNEPKISLATENNSLPLCTSAPTFDQALTIHSL